MIRVAVIGLTMAGIALPALAVDVIHSVPPSGVIEAAPPSSGTTKPVDPLDEWHLVTGAMIVCACLPISSWAPIDLCNMKCVTDKVMIPIKKNHAKLLGGGSTECDAKCAADKLSIEIKSKHHKQLSTQHE